MRLSVIIPAFNEEKRLPKTLLEVDEYLEKQGYEYEILVVSDGSTDRTAEKVKGLMGQVENLRLIDNKENHGKGYVVRQGMLEARGDFRLFMDADNSTSIEHIEKMWPEFKKGSDIVICSRDIKGSVIAVSQPLWRKRLGDIFNLIVQIISGLWGMWDTQCGFKGFTKKAAQEIFSKATINRWAFDVEVLVLARKHGLQIKEVPVTWINDSHSRVSFGGMVQMLLEVAQVRINMFRRVYDAQEK